MRTGSIPTVTSLRHKQQFLLSFHDKKRALPANAGLSCNTHRIRHSQQTNDYAVNVVSLLTVPC